MNIFRKKLPTDWIKKIKPKTIDINDDGTEFYYHPDEPELTNQEVRKFYPVGTRVTISEQCLVKGQSPYGEVIGHKRYHENEDSDKCIPDWLNLIIRFNTGEVDCMIAPTTSVVRIRNNF